MGAPNQHLDTGETASTASQVVAASGSQTSELRAVGHWGSPPCLAAWGMLLVIFLCNGALADSRMPPRRGKVIIIRGAFTVFSLGMNELGEKLEQHGLDVEVVADISAGRAASQLRSEYRRSRNIGPIVFIGHSRGAELGPKQARYLQRYKIPVKLVVMGDDARPPAESDQSPPVIPAGYRRPDFDCRRATLGAELRTGTELRGVTGCRAVFEIDLDVAVGADATGGQTLRTSATTKSWIQGEASILKWLMLPPWSREASRLISAFTS